MMAGIELVKNKETREPFPASESIGYRIATECRRHGLLIRPIGNIVVLVPPLTATEVELRKMSSILTKACRIACRTISS